MFSAAVRQIGLVLGVGLSLVTIYTSLYGIFDPSYQRPLTFVACIAVAIFVKPLVSRYPDHSIGMKALFWAIDTVLLAMILVAVARFVATADGMENMLIDYSVTDQYIGLAGLVAVVELTRREFGLGLSLFASLTLLYCLFGENLPLGLSHAGFSLDQVIQGMWYGFTGVFGMPVAVMIDLLYIYIIFGVVLEATGAGPALVRMAIRATGWLPGGPAHAAILASMLFGTMSGSVAANVAGTGAFTIPMIKRRGFSPAFAGAVEAAASTGGQVIPPVMGAAAFMMAQLTGTPYLLICLAALLPAFFYVAALFCAVFYEARRLDIKPTPKDELPTLDKQDWLRSLMFVVPVLTVIGVLATGRSPAMAGVWATLAALVFGFINPEIRHNPLKLVGALAQGGVAGSRIMIAIGAIGIVIAGMNLTGLGLSFAQSVAAIGNQSLFFSLLLTAAGCLVMGMGMPTLPAYLIIVLVMGPALSSFGVPIIAAHLFVFYFGVLSAVTPPVAIAAFAAAPLADANPVRIGVVSIRLCLVGFVVPFLFVFNPSLLLITTHFDPVLLVLSVGRVLLVIWALTTAFAGFGAVRLKTWSRVLRLAIAVLLIVEGSYFEWLGFALAVFTLGSAYFGLWKSKGEGAPPETTKLKKA